MWKEIGLAEIDLDTLYIKMYTIAQNIGGNRIQGGR